MCANELQMQRKNPPKSPILRRRDTVVGLLREGRRLWNLQCEDGLLGLVKSVDFSRCKSTCSVEGGGWDFQVKADGLLMNLFA